MSQPKTIEMDYVFGGQPFVQLGEGATDAVSMGAVYAAQPFSYDALAEDAVADAAYLQMFIVM